MHSHNTILAFIEENKQRIWKICQMYSNTEEDKNDLFQEIMYQLCQSLPSFREDCQPSTFIYRVALNTAITYFKKEKIRSGILNFSTLDIFSNLQAAHHAENERVDELHEAIHKLNKIEKAIILLYLEEMPLKEIAEVVGISHENTRVKIFRIKHKLSALLNI